MNRRKLLQALTTPLLVMASPAIPRYAAGGYVEDITGSMLLGESTSHAMKIKMIGGELYPSRAEVMRALTKPNEPACASDIQHPVEVFDKRDWLSNEIFEMLRERARLRYKDRLRKTETDAIGLYHRCLVEVTIEYHRKGETS